LRCPKTASLPFLGCKFFAPQKTYETSTAGLLPAAARKLQGTFGWSLGQSPKLRKPKRYAFWFAVPGGLRQWSLPAANSISNIFDEATRVLDYRPFFHYNLIYELQTI
jgi:hypothetical protein